MGTFPILDGFRVTLNGELVKKTYTLVYLADAGVVLKRVVAKTLHSADITVNHFRGGMLINSAPMSELEDGVNLHPNWHFMAFDTLEIWSPRKIEWLGLTAVFQREVSYA